MLWWNKYRSCHSHPIWYTSDFIKHRGNVWETEKEWSVGQRMIIIFHQPNNRSILYDLLTPLPCLLPKKNLGITPMLNKDNSASSTQMSMGTYYFFLIYFSVMYFCESLKFQTVSTKQVVSFHHLSTRKRFLQKITHCIIIYCIIKFILSKLMLSWIFQQYFDFVSFITSINWSYQ